MHKSAVITLCVLVIYFIWRDFAALLVAWYSGAQPPVTTKTKVFIWFRAAVALAAGGVALLTL